MQQMKKETVCVCECVWGWRGGGVCLSAKVKGTDVTIATSGLLPLAALQYVKY